ncbi:MAG: exodeoxyribonuclease V subunit alpha [Proteobacteria bacterium]|nr:exodeoxyribonuclease V subunit alpha [Desulfobulbaceae bacterium]MBU4153978.1 exodeoxyribonuclease V subunit alpha [Pseudomonadota bacterium]
MKRIASVNGLLPVISPMRELLHRAVLSGQCSELSACYYDFFQRLFPGAGEVAWASGVLAVQAVLDGHSCLMLFGVAGKVPFAERMELETWDDSCRMPSLEFWQETLSSCPFVGSRDSELTPLVLDRGRLYLRRYFDYERRLAAEVTRRVVRGGFSSAEVAPVLAQLFPDPITETDWQKVAAATAAMRRFCLITGGPGTGKTHTVVRIVALLQRLAGGDTLRIGLAAPTGKAASRLQESLPAAEVELAEHLEGKPLTGLIKAQTIHRLLGYVRNSPYFRYNRDQRLPLDVLIVDEVSMVDLALMTKLIEAMPDEGRLILLGDKDQLSSVEAGRVLADLCAGETGYSPAFAEELQLADAVAANLPVATEAGPLSDCRVILRKSYRFHLDSGIGALAASVLLGDVEKVMACLAEENGVRLCVPTLVGSVGVREEDGFVQQLCQGYGEFLKESDPALALAAFRKFQVLCAHRHGVNGSLEINSWFETVLEEKGLISRHSGSTWYPGRPVMVTGNHYTLHLFNGDLGVVLKDDEGELRVFFETQGGVRSIAPARMPDHDTAFALTVHKSQGSEFERVVLLLPEVSSRLVTRELIYTAITRARREFEVWGRVEILAEGVSTMTLRDTGLVEQLR